MKIMKFGLIVMMIFTTFFSYSQHRKDSVNWMHFDTVREAFLERQKPVMIFLYSEASDSSRIMSETTFSNPEVANYINILFYPLRMDIHTKDSLTFFDGRSYVNSASSGPKHDLAFMLSGDNDTLPALVLFDRNAQGRTVYGFQDRDEIFRVLIYYAENIGDNVEFEDWLTYHRRAFPAGQEQVITRLNVRWLPLDEAMEKQKTQPKKILLNFYDYRRVSCTVLRTKVFNDKRISDYINSHYYPVNVDVFSKDTLEIFGLKYINEEAEHGYHQLPIAALGGVMKFPAFLIIDENNKVREKFQNFFTVEQLQPILEYYGEDAYLKESWQDFLESYNLRKVGAETGE